MTKRRIVERTYNGMTRYVVQYKVLCFWIDNPSFHVGNNNIDTRDDWGYWYIEGAQECLRRCNAKDYIGERVVE